MRISYVTASIFIFVATTITACNTPELIIEVTSTQSLQTLPANPQETYTAQPTYAPQSTYTPQPTSTNAGISDSAPSKTLVETVIIPTHTSIATSIISNISTESSRDFQSDAPPTSTQQPTSEPTATFTSIPPTTIPTHTEIIQMPAISDTTTGIPTYNRSEWSHWSDADRDCQNTRHEVLIAESISPVSFKSASQCQVNTGLWYDPFIGSTVSVELPINGNRQIKPIGASTPKIGHASNTIGD